MNRVEFIREVTSALRKKDVRKPVSIPKHVFHISDDDGNTRDFYVKKTDKNVIFTADDVEHVLDAAIEVINDMIKRGDELSIRGFGILGVKYRKAREVTNVGDGAKMIAEDRYVPKFLPGKDLKMAAMVYGLTMRERNNMDTAREPYEEDRDD